MLITVNADGTTDFTRNPTALALAPEAHMSVVRMSEVLFDEGKQAFYIRWLTGHGSIRNHVVGRTQRWMCYFIEGNAFAKALEANPTKSTPKPGERMYWSTYEAAVAVEVGLAETLRTYGADLHQ